MQNNTRRACLYAIAFGVRRVFASLLVASATLSPIASRLDFFRGERRLDDSAKVAAGIFAGLGGAAKSCCSYRHSM